jgi:hypothetical protein
MIGRDRSIPKRLTWLSISACSRSRFFSESGSIAGAIRYCGCGRFYANEAIEKRLAS